MFPQGGVPEGIQVWGGEEGVVEGEEAKEGGGAGEEFNVHGSPQELFHDLSIGEDLDDKGGREEGGEGGGPVGEGEGGRARVLL
eukprot:evm.model.NODE_51228_length_15441_cov_14.725665.1